MSRTKLEKLIDKAVEMGLPVHVGMSLEEVEAMIAAAKGAGDNGAEGELGEKETQTQAGDALGSAADDEGDDEEELGKISPEAWKEARAALREADAECGWSIDEYSRRKEINALKERYNSKERTVELFNAIMALEDRA